MPANTPRIDLGRCDDPRDAVHRAVACLAGGGLVAIPTESGPALAASAPRPGAADRLRHATGLAGPGPIPIGLRDAFELDDWIPDPPTLGRRLALRGWPGPLTLTFPNHRGGSGWADRLPEATRDLVTTGGILALRCPAHPFVRDVAGLLAGPMLLVDADPAPAPGPIDLWVVEEPGTAPAPTTWVDVSASGWELRTEGAVTLAQIRRHAARSIVFVCTGNTCRSPMAEALCRVALAKRLGCEPDQVLERGWAVESVGVAAGRGGPATPEAIVTLRAQGIDLAAHRSRPLARDVVDHADLLVAMTRDHLEMLLDRRPDLADRATLLCADGSDVDDPYGGSQAVYDRTAGQIAEQVELLLDDWLGRAD